MKGQICLITGATSGIGKVAALELAKKGAHVVIHGRNASKAEATRKEIAEASGNEHLDILVADMSSLSDVRKLAQQFINKYERLDVLINNAGGVMNEERALTSEGFEKTIAVNFLAPFLLTALLFDKLKQSRQARIVNTSSMAYNMANPNLSDFHLDKKYTSWLAYANAKLYLILFTREMAKRLAAAGIKNIIVNALHPGVVRTNFSLESTSKMKLFFSLFNRFLLSPEKGAKTIIYLASDDEALKYTGEFLKKEKPVKVREKFTSATLTQQVWEIAEKATAIKFL